LVDDFVAIGSLVDANNVDLLGNDNVDLIMDMRSAFDLNEKFNWA
jgi:hypothetical protein